MKTYNGPLNPKTFFGYGYSPGDSTCICSQCNNEFGPADEKSIHCLNCVEKMINKSNFAARLANYPEDFDPTY